MRCLLYAQNIKVQPEQNDPQNQILLLFLIALYNVYLFIMCYICDIKASQYIKLIPAKLRKAPKILKGTLYLSTFTL